MYAAAPVTHFDLFTTKLMASVTMLVVSAATVLAWRSARQVAGMSRFTLGLLAIAVGGVFSLARVFFPGVPIILAGNALMLGGQLTVVQGIRAFRGLRAWRASVMLGFCAIVVPLFCWWLFVDDQFGRRVGLMSAAFAVLSIDAAVSLLRRVERSKRLLYWPTGFAFAFVAASWTGRSYAAFDGYYGSGMLSPVPVEMVTTICSPLAYVLCAIGMVLASNSILRTDAETLALRDPLTGLPNRRLFMDRLIEAERRAFAADLRFGLIYFDLDDFKQVNDVLGHDVGDLLLRNASAALTRNLRPHGCLGRLGGDEFVVLVEDVLDRREVMALAEKMKLAVETLRTGDEAGSRVRVSCGIAVYPDDGASAHDVMREADAAMYATKRGVRLSGPRGHEPD